MTTNDTSTDNIYDFLRGEGLSYRDTVIDLSEKITAFLIDGTSDSMARASELTKSLLRLIDLDA
jgi:hypothetical protein